MRLLTYHELSRYTVHDLRELLRELLYEIGTLEHGSLAIKNAWLNIRLVRLVLEQRRARPCLRM